MSSYRSFYSSFFKANPELLHFTAHSHHPWPDVSYEGQKNYWQDSAQLTDRKWEKIFSQVIPEAQGHLAQLMNLSRPQNISFSSNTFDFILRLFSCFPPQKQIHVLTTDSEFHSLKRQLSRWEEDHLVRITTVPTRPFQHCAQRFTQAMEREDFDVVFLSHVFFNSGHIFPLEELPDTKAMLIIDNYHALGAIPCDYRLLEERAFIVGGGYKYLQSGEGLGFLYAPPKAQELRPRITGWMSDFSGLEGEQQKLQYGPDFLRFMGATFDASGLYRFNAVMDWMPDAQEKHRFIKNLQNHFLERLQEQGLGPLTRDHLLIADLESCGHFLTFEHPQAASLAQSWEGVSVDVRGDRLRFGFGLYQDFQMIDDLFQRLS